MSAKRLLQCGSPSNPNCFEGGTAKEGGRDCTQLRIGVYQQALQVLQATQAWGDGVGDGHYGDAVTHAATAM